MRAFYPTLLFLGFASFGVVLTGRMPSLFQSRKVIALVYHENCGGKTYPANFEDFTFIRNGSTNTVSLKIVTHRRFPPPIRGEFRVIRCEDRTDRSTCKLYVNFPQRDACDFAHYPAYLKNFMAKLDPPPQCPMPKGEFNLRNFVLPTDVIAALLAQDSRDRTLWITRLTMWENSEMVACFETGQRIANARVRP